MNNRKTAAPDTDRLRPSPDRYDPRGQRDKRQHQRQADQFDRLIAAPAGQGNSGRRAGGGIGFTHTHAISPSAETTKAPERPGPLPLVQTVAYFSEELIEVNLVFRLEPRPFTTAMIASEMPAAMRPYSIAVAPDWSFTKRAIRFFIS